MASEVSIYIKRDDLILGPFSESQTVARYHRGEFNGSDLAMIDGMTGWHPLATYVVEESDTAPASFDASASPLPIRRETYPELPEEPAPADQTEPAEFYLEPIQIHRGGSSAMVKPMVAAWALLGLGVLAMVLSRWPWTLWVPPILGALALGIQQMTRRNYANALPLLAVTLLLPWFVWTQWLAKWSAGSHPAATMVEAEPAMPPPAPAATPAPEAKVAEVPLPVAPPPARSPEPPPQVPIAKGDRVALTRDTLLLFEGKDFRLGKEGEEFEVLLALPDKLYLKTKEPRGRVIAVTAAPSELRLVAPAPQAPPPVMVPQAATPQNNTPEFPPTQLVAPRGAAPGAPLEPMVAR